MELVDVGRFDIEFVFADLVGGIGGGSFRWGRERRVCDENRFC